MGVEGPLRVVDEHAFQRTRETVTEEKLIAMAGGATALAAWCPGDDSIFGAEEDKRSAEVDYEDALWAPAGRRGLIGSSAGGRRSALR